MPTTLADLARGWGAVSEQLSAPPRVLLVDDEAAIREMFRTVLTRANFECTVCDSGEQALEQFARERCDLLVIDKNLPGIGGLEVIAKIREQDPEVESVLISGYPSLKSVLQAIDLQKVEFLTKPLDSIEVLTAVLGRARLRRSRRLLARRMLSDLRTALSEHADDAAVKDLREARARVDRYRATVDTKKRVLCWQNEESPVLAALDQMSDSGFEIWRVERGVEVLERCERHQVAVLVVSDTFGDMTGTELVEQLAEAQGRPELVYITDRGDFDAAISATHRGAAGYIVKPFEDPRPFVHAVRRACDLQHERMVHFKMVTELSRVLTALELRRDSTEARKALHSALSEFDVRSAEHALRTGHDGDEPA
ncbi:MAG: response regulator [Myxococcota bacterium]